MTRSTWVLAAMLAITGCSKKKDEGVGAGTGTASGSASGGAVAKGGPEMPISGDCDRLGKKTSELSMQNTPPDTTTEMRAKLQAISDEAGLAIAELCKVDKWTADAVACGLAATDPAKECDAKLTADQKAHMQEKVMAIFAKLSPPKEATGGTPTP